MSPPREKLTQHRRIAGLSQERLAELVGVSFSTVSRWERGVGEAPRPAYLKGLADALAMEATEVERIFEPETAISKPLQPWELESVLHQQSITPALLDTFEADVASLDVNFGAIPRQQLRQEITFRLTATSDWLAQPQPTHIRRRLVSVTGRLACLQGCLAFDGNDMRTAQQWLRAGEFAAMEAEDPELLAWILGHQSLVHVDEGSYHRAATTLENSLSLKGVTPTMTAWLTLLSAPVAALNGELDLRDRTEDAFRQRIAATESSARRHGMNFTNGHLDPGYYLGLSLGHAGRSTEAREHLRSCLDAIPEQHTRARSMLLATLAHVAAVAGEGDRAIEEIESALDVARDQPAGRIHKRLLSAHRRLIEPPDRQNIGDRLLEAEPQT